MRSEISGLPIWILKRAERKKNILRTYLASSQNAGELHVSDGKGKKYRYVSIPGNLTRD
uniref:hypothetical protein n=1 Tax=Algoriphagus locisalis TaxID=305507 RepID=UPI00147AF0B9|nr:hypothetical protein [Algoriphagus locisalis]